MLILARRSLLAATLCIGAVQAWPQNAEWASHIHGSENDIVYSLCHAPNGDIYTTGRMSSGDIDGTPVSVYGTYDIFLAKYNSTGVLQWAVTAGGSAQMDYNERDAGWKVVYDSISDAIYLSGTYQGTASGNPAVFGPGISVHGKGAFLAKYDVDGTCLWMRATNNGISGSITVDTSGAIYVNCWSTDELNDSTTYYGPPFTTVPNGFSIAKYSPSGQLIWAKNIGQNISGQILALGGHILFGGGSFYDNSSFLGTSIPADGSEGLGLVASMDTACSTIEWMHVLGSNTLSDVIDIRQAGDGHLLVVGIFTNSLFLPMDTLIGASGVDHPFYLLADSSGTVDWVYSLDATVSGVYVSPAPAESFYLGFKFTGSFTLPTGTVTANNEWDFAIVRCQSDGSPIGVLQNGPVEPTLMDILATDDNGVVLTGRFSGTIDLGGRYVFTGNSDIFVVKYGEVTGIREIKSLSVQQLLIYANPNNGTCTIELPEGLQWNSGLVLNIYDMQGKLVQQESIGKNSVLRLDISAQAKGSYPVELTDGQQRYTGTIVFE